jgi:hypothetical protein
MHTAPPQSPTATPGTPDPIAVARGLIAAAMSRGAAMPDLVAFDLAGAWDDLDDPTLLPEVVPADPDHGVTPAEQLLRARIALRHAIPTINPAPRALRLASAIRHLDAALARLDGWTDGGRERWA